MYFNKHRTNWYVFLLIFLLAVLVRGTGITWSPPSLFVDETVIGYNAYSLSETGRDEYGKKWPVLLRSYGAFSSTLYTFVTAPIVKIFGLNAVSVRLLSVVSGVFLVVLVGWQWGLIAAWLTAIAPVFVFFSRSAYESNFALVLLVSGLFTGIRYLKSVNKTWLLLLSSFLFALSTYAYLAERLISPVMFIAIGILGIKKLIKQKHSVLPVLLASILFITISLPLIKVSFTSGANQRLLSLLPGKPINPKETFVNRYYAYFSPQNIFSRPDPDVQRSYPEVSTFYWWWLFPFTVGLYAWLRKIKEWNFEDWLLILLLLISPLTGAVTKDYFSTLRVLPMFVSLIWIISKGIKQTGRFQTLVVILFTFFGITTLYYNANLLRHERNKDWLYPYADLAIQSYRLRDKPIILDNSRLKPFYIYYAYVNKIDPKIMQKWHNFDLTGYYSYYNYSDNMDFQNIQIRPFDFKDIYNDCYIAADELAISPSQAKEHYLQKVTSVENLDGTIAYNIYQTHPLDKCKNDLLKDTDKVNPFCVKYLK